MMTSDPLLGIKEFEDLEYMGAITPQGNAYKLLLISKGDTDDENRLFLLKEFKLVEEATSGNIFEFSIITDGKKIGRLHFSYYPDTEYKTFQICMEYKKSDAILTDMSITFGRIRKFSIKP